MKYFCLFIHQKTAVGDLNTRIDKNCLLLTSSSCFIFNCAISNWLVAVSFSRSRISSVGQLLSSLEFSDIKVCLGKKMPKINSLMMMLETRLLARSICEKIEMITSSHMYVFEMREWLMRAREKNNNFEMLWSILSHFTIKMEH